MNMERSKRAPNFTKAEEELLITLVSKYDSILECKKTDATSNRLKEAAWNKVAEEFSLHESTFRDSATLRRKYDNLKKRTKRIYGADGYSAENLTQIEELNTTAEYNNDATAGISVQDASEGDMKPCVMEMLVEPIPSVGRLHQFLSNTKTQSITSENKATEIPCKSEPGDGDTSTLGVMEILVEPTLSVSIDVDAPSTRKLLSSVRKRNGCASESDPIEVPLKKSSSSKKKLEDIWCRVAESKLELIALQKESIDMELESKIEWGRKEHELKIELASKESQMKMKCEHEEHLLRMELLRVQIEKEK